MTVARKRTADPSARRAHPDGLAVPDEVRRAAPRRPRQGRGPRAAIVPDRFYREMVDSMRTGVLAITLDGRVAAMNALAYRILGLKPRPGDIGRHYARVLADHREITRILVSAFELTHLPNRAELRLKTSGKVIGYTLSHILDEQGRTTGAALFFKDLTRVEQLEERERLRDRLAALGEMAAAIAHEVKNPLAGIEVMAGVLRRQLGDYPDAQAILNDIINEAKMANAIVLEVLEFVRPIRLQVEQIDLLEVVRDAVSIAESQTHRGAIDVRVVVPDETPAIHGDPHQLRQLFVNLLTNAFEALGHEGRVEIAASHFSAEYDATASGDVQPTSLVAVEVADTGPGVPPDLTDRIFSPFFTTKPRGSGLGLAIVRKIVDAHDGRIDVTPRPGGGTVFRVTLPVGGAADWYSR
jgi:signal transduction histidine kinase